MVDYCYLFCASLLVGILADSTNGIKLYTIAEFDPDHAVSDPPMPNAEILIKKSDQLRKNIC